jgi:hypothetical protein
MAVIPILFEFSFLDSKGANVPLHRSENRPDFPWNKAPFQDA